MPRTAKDRRIHPVGDAQRFSEAEALARIKLRPVAERRGWDADLEDAQSAAVEAICNVFRNLTVRAGCIARGKLRRDREYVRVYLIWRLTRASASRLAGRFGVSPRSVYHQIERGRRLVEAAERDGRIGEALARLRRRAEEAEG